MKKQLSASHKAKMQAGRRKAKAKALEGIIPKEEKVKKEKVNIVYGWRIDKEDNSIQPVFNSEKDSYKHIYRKIEDAVKVREDRNGR